MSGVARNTKDLQVDNRALINFALECHKRNGGQVLLPSGMEDAENWLLDGLNVKWFIEALRKDRNVELARLADKNAQDGSASEPSNTPGIPRTDSIDSAWEHIDPEIPNTPRIRLAELNVSLDEYDLQEIAFTLFALYCAKPKDGHLVDSIRRQLELSEATAEDINKIIKPLKNWSGAVGHPQQTGLSGASDRISQERRCLTPRSDRSSSPTTPSGGTTTSHDSSWFASSAGTSTAPNLQLFLLLIKRVRPSDFRKFKSFVQWREALVHVLVETLRYATQTGWKSVPNGANAKTLLARLQGAIRRLSCVDPDDFDEEEYSEASDAVIYASNAIVEHVKSGWDFTWGFRVKLWQTCLCCIFDDLEDGLYIPSKEKYLSRLQKYLAPKLGIPTLLHRACYAWVHFMQFAQEMNPDMLAKLSLLLEDLKKAEAFSDSDAGDLDKSFARKVSQGLVEWVEHKMLDYHLNVPESDNMGGLLSLLLASSPTEDSREKLASTCIASSISRAFQRLVPHTRAQESSTILMTLAKKAVELFDAELLNYTGHLALFCPAAASIAARQLHDSYGQVFLPELHKLESLPDDVIDMLLAADELERALMPNISEEDSSSEACTPWNVLSAVEPIIINIAESKVEQLRVIASRLIEGEDWTSVSESEPVSRSVVELKQLLFASLSTLFEMNLLLPEESILILLRYISDEIVEYGVSILAGLGDRHDMIPPLPNMTRFKKDLANLAEQSEQSGPIMMDKKPVYKKITTLMKEKIKEPIITSSVPEITEARCYEKISKMTAWNLLVRINSLQFLKNSVPELQEVVETKWSRHYSASFGKGPSSACISDILAGAEQSLENNLNECCFFVGTKIVYWDMRKMWLEDLHRHRVRRGGISPVLDKLNKHLTALSDGATVAVLDKIAGGLTASCAECYKRVLLDGGPYRLFLPADTEDLESDIAELKSFFYAGGEGLSRDTVDSAFRPLSELITLMALETSVLVASANKLLGSSQASQSSPDGQADNLENFTKILAHRSEREASKWLKKQYKIPKRLKSN